MLYGSVVEGGDKRSVSGLLLVGRLCSILTVMRGGDLDVATQKLLDRTIGKVSMKVSTVMRGGYLDVATWV